MRYPVQTIAISAVLLGAALVMGCSKKIAVPATMALAEGPPAAPAANPAPMPTIVLSASLSTIEEGQSSTLSWHATAATEVTIDGGIGDVEPSGSHVVKPYASTTYKARAAGPGGEAFAEVRVTVVAAPVIPSTALPLRDDEFFP